MARPSPPTSLQVDGHPETGSVIVTKNTDGSVLVSAIIDDPDAGQRVRMMVRWSTTSKFTKFSTAYGTYGPQGIRRNVSISRLQHNTKYYGRAYTQDARGAFSTNYNGFQFYTDRNPDAATLVSPAENALLAASSPIVFDWQHHDPDAGDGTPGASILQWRVAATPLTPAGGWKQKTINGAVTTWTMPANTLAQSNDYEWRVRTRDPHNLWGPWSNVRSLATLGVSKTPLPRTPSADVVLPVDDIITFTWQFRDPVPTAVQGSADVRYRVLGTPTWVTVFDAATTDQSVTFDPTTFAPGYRYEWQVRTTRTTGDDPTSDWSVSQTFWTILTPGSLAVDGEPLGENIVGQLGTGKYRVEVYDRGGLVKRGEITGISNGRWTRKRDDISDASIVVEDYSYDCGKLLGSLNTWAYELVIWRDNQRVWEGPITLITQTKGRVEISAKDPMAYLYRRILRQGYNDSYRIQGGIQRGLKSVVERAGLITINCLGYADPNVLPYLTTIETGQEAKQSRVVPDFSKTAWEEIDDLAANAGLDYTTVGRRIIYWGTHTPLGVLPEMRDGDFSDPLIVSEYGMSAANYFAVTDGQGAYGASYAPDRTKDNWSDYYGPLEQLASGYGVNADTAATTDPEALARLRETLAAQAKRNIAPRWPAPLVARVPDGSGIKPTVNVTINQLVPGVWIPLRVQDVVRPFAQMQKLDSISVEFDSQGERIGVTMSPAPTVTQDPDAEALDSGEETG